MQLIAAPAAYLVANTGLGDRSFASFAAPLILTITTKGGSCAIRDNNALLVELTRLEITDHLGNKEMSESRYYTGNLQRIYGTAENFTMLQSLMKLPQKFSLT